MREKDSIGKHVRNFMVQETVLKVIGIWPTRDGSSFGRWIFAVMTQISTICSLSMEVYRHCLDVDDTMDAFVMDLSSVVSLAKLLIMRWNSRHAYTLVDSVVKDWSVVDDSRHEDVMTKYFKRGRIVSLMILYLGYASGLSFIVKALPFADILSMKTSRNTANSTASLKSSLKLNYFLATYCVFGPQPLLHHICVLVLQAMHIFVNAVAHCANDGLFFSLTMHLCGQFEILKMNFAKFEIGELGGEKKLRILVKRHCQLAVLANDLEQTFNMIVLIQLLMSALLICVDGFVFLACLGTGDNVGALKSVVLMVTLLIQLYLYAYAGDALESRTEEIAQAVYQSLWYRSRGRAARDLVLIINRGNLSCHLTAGKFLSMNIFTFKEILKTSASYLSVLKVMMKTKEGKVMESLVDPRLAKMKTTLSKDFVYAMTPFKLLSWPVGTWPLQNYDIFAFMRTVITLILLSLMIAILHTELYFDSSDAEKNLDSVVLIACGSLAITKVASFRIWPMGLIYNFTSAIRDYNELRDEEKRAIVRKHAYMGRMACILMMGGAYASATLVMAVPVLVGERLENIVNVTEEKTLKYPMPSNHVMEFVKMPDSLYFVVFITEFFAMIVTCTGNVGSDVLFLGISFHVCGQIEILKLEFNQLANRNEKTMGHLVALVRRHVDLLNMVKMLNETIGSALIMQLFFSCVLICTSGFQFILALSIGNIVMILKTFILINTLLLQLFMYSYIGEYLKRRMEGIGNSLYFCRWYDIPRNVVKDMIYVIMKAQDPVFLKAGKLFVINLQTYMSIVKSSMSYLSVLRVMVNT
ncbi:hypothetical protein E2986_13856 [Frieseomelitta varia]|uniref:Odorant receptor n=1 Tax=Frieseomelitta varia TaxID=561572 RepID=A0A833RZK5_9HYME|nr:hypothetical protein E2986_13856 [Frieseomelitta varia]